MDSSESLLIIGKLAVILAMVVLATIILVTATLVFTLAFKHVFFMWDQFKTYRELFKQSPIVVEQVGADDWSTSIRGMEATHFARGRTSTESMGQFVEKYPNLTLKRRVIVTGPPPYV